MQGDIRERYKNIHRPIKELKAKSPPRSEYEGWRKRRGGQGGRLESGRGPDGSKDPKLHVYSGKRGRALLEREMARDGYKRQRSEMVKSASHEERSEEVLRGLIQLF